MLTWMSVLMWFICMGVYTHTYKPHQHVSVNMLYTLQNTCTRDRRASFLILLMMGA